MRKIYSVIKGSGSYIPKMKIEKDFFLNSYFFDDKSNKIKLDTSEIVDKLKEISGIESRFYAEKNQLTSDLATNAAINAIESAQIDAETINYIIVAHNFGDVYSTYPQTDILPNLAARVKHNLKIMNQSCIAFDIIAGCPGFVQAFIVADNLIKSGKTKRILVIGAETISRITDPYDRDKMLFGDGAGAFIIEGMESDCPLGVISFAERCDTYNEKDYIKMGDSLNPDYRTGYFYIRIQGRRLYNYAVTNVPSVVAKSITNCGLSIKDIKKVFIHQANTKMNLSILKGLFNLFGINDIDESVMPMTISKLGNTSTATIPTTFDLYIKGKIEGEKLKSGDHICFCSVGAGMIINSIIYRIP